MRLNWTDRIIQPFAPRLAAKRAIARSWLDGERDYDGAALGRRTQGRRAPSTSADAEISRALPRLRDRMRDLGRNNAHARKALAVWTNNLVGTGIMPRAKSGDAALDAKVMDLWDKCRSRQTPTAN